MRDQNTWVKMKHNDLLEMLLALEFDSLTLTKHTMGQDGKSGKGEEKESRPLSNNGTV